MRSVYVPSPLRPPIIAAEHRMRAGPASEVWLVMPGRQIVAAGESWSCPVRDFVMQIVGGLEPCRRGPVLLKLVVGVGHPDQPGPDLLAQPGLRFDRQLIGRQVLDALGKHRI